MAICTSQVPDSCHQRLHDVTSDPDKLEIVSVEAARMGGLDMAQRMVREGVPERTIRRYLERRPF